MSLKKGDFVIYKDHYCHEYMIVIDVYPITCLCLSIEALNDASSVFVGTSSSFVQKNLILVADEKEINRLNKIMVFK